MGFSFIWRNRMILVIDNYDSFTYNLVQLVEQYSNDISVVRNDKVKLDDIVRMKLSHILISPGPGRPENAGVCIKVIKAFGKLIPILGVCLGHQAIGFAFGCEIVRAETLMHGKTSMIYHDGKTVYKGIENPFEATRYHSLIIERDTIPPELVITSETQDGIIMGVRHKVYPIEGIQFHPESILTRTGEKLISNWLNDD